MKSSEFGQLLCKYRNDRGFTQGQLAERAKLSTKTISQLERSGRIPHTDTIYALADEKALNLSDAQRDALLSAAGLRPTSPLWVAYTPNVQQISFWARFSWALTTEAHESGVDGVDGVDRNTPSHAIVPFYHNESIRMQLGQLHFCYNHLRHSIAGVIIAPACGLNDEDRKGEHELIPLLKNFLDAKIPIVFIDRRMIVGGYFYEYDTEVKGEGKLTDVGQSLNIPHVGLDDYMAGYKAAEAILMKLQLRQRDSTPKIALVWDAKALSMHYLRAKGAQEGLKTHYNPNLETFGDIQSTPPTTEDFYNFRGVGARAGTVLGQWPDAVICGTSYIARMVYYQLHANASGPRPLIVSLDDVPELPLLDPHIGRVNYTPHDLAHHAIRKLQALRDSEPTAHTDDWNSGIEVYFQPPSLLSYPSPGSFFPNIEAL